MPLPYEEAVCLAWVSVCAALCIELWSKKTKQESNRSTTESTKTRAEEVVNGRRRMRGKAGKMSKISHWSWILSGYPTGCCIWQQQAPQMNDEKQKNQKRPNRPNQTIIIAICNVPCQQQLLLTRWVNPKQTSAHLADFPKLFCIISQIFLTNLGLDLLTFDIYYSSCGWDY